MSVIDQTPTFNLKAVLKETGLKPDTLRAWERRYGLPQPQRSAGGHRLYSQHDIEIIKWLIFRQQEGMSISRAVDLWHSLESEGEDPLQMSQFARPEPEAAVVSLLAGDTIVEQRRQWVSACLAFDERWAEGVLAQAFALYPVETVCLEVLQKGLSEMGEGWYQGQITAQQEHFASELSVRRIEALLATTPRPTRAERILVGCPPHEEHVFSSLLLTLFLRRRGWDILYLGANVPLERLEATIAATQPQLVILAAQQLRTAATLLKMAQVLQEHNIPLAFGGMVFNLLPALRSLIPGYFLGERLDLAHQVVEQMLSSPPELPPVRPASKVHQQALAHYRERQAQIGTELWHMMGPTDIDHDYLEFANTHLSLNIMAALALEDLDLLSVDLEWLKGLLRHYRLPDELLRRYLRAYYQAAQQHLDERGAPIVAYLARLSGTNSK
ncbi:MAG: MerR family transcriptional regulator [Anaerolineales bacterium]|nr:MAG: MerR family transcriptional regulator [Anaerolineales bacterium]